MKPELIKPFVTPADGVDTGVALLDETEVFSRDGKDFQIFILPVVLSLPTSLGLKDFNELSALPALASIIRKLPWFAGRAVEIAPRLFVGSRLYGEKVFSSVNLARTGNWDLVPKELENEYGKTGADVTILDRLVCVRHVYIRVAGVGALRETVMPLPNDVEFKLTEMMRFALDNHSTRKASETMVLNAAVKLMPIVPFASGIWGFDAMRNRAVLSHIALAAATAEVGKQPIAYQAVQSAFGTSQLKVFAFKQKGEWQVEAVLDNLTVAAESPEEGEAVSKALLIEMAAAYEVKLENLDAVKVSH